MNQLVARVLLVWFVAAVLLVSSGVLERVPPPVFLVTLAAASTSAALSSPRTRRYFGAIDLRWLLLPHFVRFVGGYLLHLVESGALPPMFRAIGWGDLIAACGAVLLLLVGSPGARGSGSWSLWLAWSLFGAGDMALLVSRAVPAVRADPELFRPFYMLPMGLLPTFAVPLIIATHVLILLRLVSRRESAAA